MAKRKKRIRRDYKKQTECNDEGLLWVQEIQVRPKSERKPRARARLTLWKRRLLSQGKKTQNDTPQASEQDAEKSKNDESKNDESKNDESPAAGIADVPEEELANASQVESGVSNSESYRVRPKERRQYSFVSMRRHRNIFERLKNMTSVDTDEHSYSPSILFMRYINWTFRAGFFILFLSFLIFFILIVFAFGGFLKVAGDAQPECITAGGEIFGTNPDTKLADAFALSWTTFTTVGYGMTYTTTGNEFDDQRDCSAVIFLCTVEAFVGLLYAGMCTAILFGKVGRIQSHAQVYFSDAMCIEYGEEVRIQYSIDEMKEAEFDDSFVSLPDDQSDVIQGQDSVRYRCPILKFQIVNQLCNESGGEIMDAMLRAVAADNKSINPAEAPIAKYMKINLMEWEHPFFNRVWHGRHTLNEFSPLLTAYAKQQIRINGGYWPADWNTPEKVRESLNFTHFIVTLFGISNVSASTVHAYKRYKYEDVLIGFQFAPVLYKRPDTNRLKVDMTLINDVIEQQGGRAEGFDDICKISPHSLHPK